MQKDKKYLLSTRPLPKKVIEEAAAEDVVIEELSFIETSPVHDENIITQIKELGKQQHTVIFTSMNAVEAVAAQVPTKPGWNIYAIGNTTRKLIKQAWGEDVIAGVADNAQHLGERLIDDGRLDIVFFCGDIRRDELPNKIRSEGGSVEEIVVYETTQTPSVVTKDYDAILFFSPSAVNSFFSANKVSPKTELFAIGKTTADTLKRFAHKKIIIARQTDKTELARQAIQHLNKIK